MDPSELDAQIVKYIKAITTTPIKNSLIYTAPIE
jgi:hypothetical protein